MTDTQSRTDEFFERYQSALLARDEQAIAELYAVPSLILFPGQSLVVTGQEQTEQFFAAAWGQYDGVTAVDRAVEIMGEAPGTVWAVVTWSYEGRPRERFCYQLVDGPSGYQIGVLTPMS
jgi:ketosteroid isomerase-like protein